MAEDFQKDIDKLKKAGLVAVCTWCGHEYTELNQTTENLHLVQCRIFQSLPVAEVKDGKQFVRLIGYPHILIERSPAN